MSSYRAEWTLGLLALLMTASTGAGLLAAEPSAEESLAKLGLKHAGVMLVLETESRVHTKIESLRHPANELSNTLMLQRSTLSAKDYQATLKELDAEMKQFRGELTATNQTINQFPRYRGRLANNLATEQVNELNVYKNQLQAEINQRTAFLNQLKSRPFDPKARAKLDVDVKDQREALQKAAQEARTLVEAARDQYAALAKDPAFKKAQNALEKKSRATFRLGPTRQFQTDVKLLERVERLASPSEGNIATGKDARSSRAKGKGKR